MAIHRKPVKQSLPDFDREETIVCMVLAFCIAAASVQLIYTIMG
jgi:hypothetical protein